MKHGIGFRKDSKMKRASLLILAAVLLFSGCTPMNLNGENPDEIIKALNEKEEKKTGEQESGEKEEEKEEKDLTPPDITGARDMNVRVGGNPNYLAELIVTDDDDPDVKIVVDDSRVNLNEPGTYPLVYRATDKSGNVREIEIKITVK